MSEPNELAERAARDIAERTGVARHDIAVVLGSGWSGATTLLGGEAGAMPAGELPGFHSPAVGGHAPMIRSIAAPAGSRVLVLGARRHYYEGRDASAVAHPVRTAAAAGCRTLILTNASGSTQPEIGPGTPVLISDHLNLTGASPLEGAAFVDMTDAYSPRLRAIAREVDPTLTEGVYAQFPGPQYETPAEVRMAAKLGATLVGMSTALETIAARAEDIEVLGLSLVTNLAAGIAPTPLSHEEVLAAGKAAEPRISSLLAEIVARI